jgi:hypothetical protein
VWASANVNNGLLQLLALFPRGMYITYGGNVDFNGLNNMGHSGPEKILGKSLYNPLLLHTIVFPLGEEGSRKNGTSG